MEYIIVAIQVLSVFIIGLFIKSYFPSYMKKKAENLATIEDIRVITTKVEEARLIYATKLEETKRALQADLENVKHQLMLIAQERQIKLSTLQEKRAEAMSYIYYSLMQAMDKGERFQGVVKVGGVKESNAHLLSLANETYKACDEFLSEFNKHKLYFDESLQEKIEAAVKPVRYLSFKYGFYSNMLYKDQPEKFVTEFNDLWKEFQNESSNIRTALKAIEEEFRIVIGAKEQDTPLCNE